MSSWLEVSQAVVKLALILGLMACSHVFYQPIKGALVEPTRFSQHQPQDVELEAADGTKLSAWVFRAQDPKGTILQFHGNGENMSTHFLNLVWLVDEGYDLLVFDYRGYGFSQGFPDQAGVHMDALVAMDWAFHDHERRKTQQLIFFGQSLGGQIAARAIVDFAHQQAVDLLVLDSTFPSYQQIAATKLKSRWFLWPFLPLAYLAVSDRFAAREVMGKIQTPVLGMHSPTDPVVPYELGLEGFTLIRSQKWWWKVRGGGHTDAFHLKNSSYRQQFLELLRQTKGAKNSL